MNEALLAVAAQSVRFSGDSLEDRLRSAMKDVRNRGDEILWMSHGGNDDFGFRAAVAAVMLKATEEERGVITRSMQPLKMLSAAQQGIPVDFGCLNADEDILPLIGMWHESKSDDH